MPRQEGLRPPEEALGIRVNLLRGPLSPTVKGAAAGPAIPEEAKLDDAK